MEEKGLCFRFLKICFKLIIIFLTFTFLTFTFSFEVDGVLKLRAPKPKEIQKD